MASNDTFVWQKNPSNNAWQRVAISPAASSVAGFDSGETADNMPISGGLKLDGSGNLSLAGVPLALFNLAAAPGSLRNDGSDNLSWVATEPALGNPASSGMVLTSTTGGVRSWVLASSIIAFVFFGFDSLTDYADGPLDAPDKGFSWGGVGAVTVPETCSTDPLTDYANGPLDAPNGGTGWGAAGSVTVPN